MLCPGSVMRTRVYVDGFNLFYGSLKGTPFKWLDPVRLAALLVPRGHTIDRLRYFTARVSGKSDPGAPGRQQMYLKALATLPEVEIHYGQFSVPSPASPAAASASRRSDRAASIIAWSDPHPGPRAVASSSVQYCEMPPPSHSRGRRPQVIPEKPVRR